MSPLHMITVKIIRLHIILVLLIACFQVSIFMNQTLAIFYVKFYPTLKKVLTAKYFTNLYIYVYVT